MSERRITISGPGPVGAIQQAVSAGKTAIWVVDQHPFGYVLRIGYYLHPNNSDPPPVTWFSRDEVTITFDRSEEPHLRSAKLEVNFQHPKAHERHALIDVPAGDYKLLIRAVFRMHDAAVSTFVLQVEIKSKEAKSRTSVPVVRYDCAHGFVHRDMLGRDGTRSKIPCSTNELSSAVPIVFAELQEHLPLWLSELGYEDADASDVQHAAFVAELAKAEATLTRLLANPEEAEDIESSLVTYADPTLGRLMP